MENMIITSLLFFIFFTVQFVCLYYSCFCIRSSLICNVFLSNVMITVVAVVMFSAVIVLCKGSSDMHVIDTTYLKTASVYSSESGDMTYKLSTIMLFLTIYTMVASFPTILKAKDRYRSAKEQDKMQPAFKFEKIPDEDEQDRPMLNNTEDRTNI